MNQGIICRGVVLNIAIAIVALMFFIPSAVAQDIEDCNNNGISDICDTCNDESCEISCAEECEEAVCFQSEDCDDNGVPDSCQTDDPPACAIDCNGNGNPDVCDVNPESDTELCSLDDWNQLRQVNGSATCEDAAFAHGGGGSSDFIPSIPSGGAFHVGILSGSNNGSSSCGDSNDGPAVWYKFQATETGLATFSTVLANSSLFDGVISLHSACPGTIDTEIACNDNFLPPGGIFPDIRPGLTHEVTAGTTYWIRVGRNATSFPTFFIQLLINTGLSSLQGGTVDDCNLDDIPDSCQFGDCNFNRVLDECEISENSFLDFNGNDVIDECEDCNNNFVPDICEIEGYETLPLPATTRGPSCFGKLVGEEEEGEGSFCDCYCLEGGVVTPTGIGGDEGPVFFECGQEPDCNEDLLLDSCAPDCNGNDIPDDCDISDLNSLDCQMNSIPDECDLASQLVATGHRRDILPEFDIEAPDCFFNVNPMNGADLFVGPIGAVTGDFGSTVSDVAVAPNGNIYALVFNFFNATFEDDIFTDAIRELSIWLIDPLTGAGTLVTVLNDSDSYTGLTFGFDGTPYIVQSAFGGASGSFSSVDLVTGVVTALSAQAGITVGGHGMATSPMGSLLSVETEFFFDDFCEEGDGGCFCSDGSFGECGPQRVNILQRHDPATGEVIASAQIQDSMVLDNPDCGMDEIDPPFTVEGEYGGYGPNPACIPRFVYDIAFGDDGQLYAIVERRVETPIISTFRSAGAEIEGGFSGFRELAIIDFENFTLEPVEDPSAIIDPTVGPIHNIVNYIGGQIPPRSSDCNGTGIPDECEITSGMALDCNMNMVPDSCDLETEEAFDCNLNEIPDECDFDCDLNEIPDDCEIAEDPTLDCNANEQLDICEEGSDCNLNSIPDECELEADPALDCNLNETIDICEEGPDCNGNAVPDECELNTDGDALIDSCELCPNDPAKTEPGECGCGVADDDLDENGIADCNDVTETPTECLGLCSDDNPEFDEDGDGNSNCQEVQDETDPCDPGSLIERLEPLSCTGVNFFFDQINITSIKNHSDGTLTAIVTYRDLFGVVRGSKTLVLGPNEKRDVIVNELGAKQDEYGTVCVDTDAVVNGSWSGGTLILNPASEAEAKTRANGVAFDYALYYEFTNPQSGAIQVPLNTNILGDGGIGSTANWVRLTDAVPDDGRGLFGVIDYYDAGGKLVASEPVGIPDGGRQDFDAHLSLGQDMIGLAEFRPSDDSSPYYVETTRYQYRGSFGSAQENFFTAYTIPNRPITAAMLTGQLSTAPNELAIVEVINGSNDESVAGLDVFSGTGVSAQSSQQFSIASKGSNHTIVTGNILSSGVSASAELSSLTNGGLSALTLLYAFDSAGSLLYGFAPPFVESAGGVQRTEFNSFLGHKNFLQLRNSSDEAIDANIVVFDPVGAQLLTQTVSVAPRETEQVELAVPANTYGTIVVSTDGGKVGLVAQNNVTLEGQYVIPYPAR